MAPLGEGVCPGAGGGVPLVAELAGEGAPEGGLKGCVVCALSAMSA